MKLDKTGIIGISSVIILIMLVIGGIMVYPTVSEYFEPDHVEPEPDVLLYDYENQTSVENTTFIPPIDEDTNISKFSNFTFLSFVNLTDEEIEEFTPEDIEELVDIITNDPLNYSLEQYYFAMDENITEEEWNYTMDIRDNYFRVVLGLQNKFLPTFNTTASELEVLYHYTNGNYTEHEYDGLSTTPVSKLGMSQYQTKGMADIESFTVSTNGANVIFTMEYAETITFKENNYDDYITDSWVKTDLSYKIYIDIFEVTPDWDIEIQIAQQDSPMPICIMNEYEGLTEEDIEGSGWNNSDSRLLEFIIIDDTIIVTVPVPYLDYTNESWFVYADDMTTQEIENLHPYSIANMQFLTTSYIHVWSWNPHDELYYGSESMGSGASVFDEVRSEDEEGTPVSNTLYNVLFYVGIILIGTGVVLLIVTSKKEKEDKNLCPPGFEYNISTEECERP